METLLIEYNVRSELISRFLQAISKIVGATIRQEYIPTEEEQIAINQALNSETHTDISQLKELLKSLK